MSVIPLAVVAALLHPPQERGRAVFRVTTRAVRLDVFVGRSGRAVAGLTREDFTVYDDGEAQTLDSVNVENVPLNVVLALDSSSSVAGETLDLLRLAASGFVDELSPADHVALLTFSHTLRLRSPLTAEFVDVKRALSGIEALGATSWYDALFAALEILEPVRDRPLVLLFTDGADTYSWVSEDVLVEIVKDSSASVYAVTRGDRPPTSDLHTTDGRARWRAAQRRHALSTRVLREIVEQSAGRLYEPDSYEDLKALFLEILAEMKTRYVLTFTPRDPIRPGWHEVKVEVGRPGMEVHARRGYRFEERNEPLRRR